MHDTALCGCSPVRVWVAVIVLPAVQHRKHRCPHKPSERASVRHNDDADAAAAAFTVRQRMRCLCTLHPVRHQCSHVTADAHHMDGFDVRRGRILLRSADPLEYPEIDFRFLTVRTRGRRACMPAWRGGGELLVVRAPDARRGVGGCVRDSTSATYRS